MPEPEQLATGAILDGKYRVEALIGGGGMGTVYRARHIGLDAARAIKLMRPELAKDESFVQRFENEAHLAEGVRHPNVVALYDFATLADGTKYIVWELVEGETLRDRLERGDVFSMPDVARVVQQIGSGLAAAHERGILHRDVSPDNIMICADAGGEPIAKLLDFGVAKAAGTPKSMATTTGMVFGKAGFASPEQMGLLKGDDSLDARTDVFSLAAVAYTMLTGEPPFVTSSMRGFLHDLMIAPESEIRARFASRLDESWCELLTLALARDRDQRPPTMKAFIDAIERVGEDAASPPESDRDGTDAVSTPRSNPWRNRVLVVTALVVLASLLVPLDRLWDLDSIPAPPDVAIPPPFEVVFGTDEEDRVRLRSSEDDGTEQVREPPPPSPPLVSTTTTTAPRPEPVERRQVAIVLPLPTTSTTSTITATTTPPAPRQRAIRTEVEPIYPDRAKKLQVEGTVGIKILIDEKGDVVDAEIVQRAHRDLDKAAMDAVLQRKYEPGDTPVEMLVEIRFSLQ